MSQSASTPPPVSRLGAPRALGALLPAITRPALAQKGARAARLAIDWEQVVGPRIAAVTHPARLSGGTLTLACLGAVALELQHIAPVLIERINRLLGPPRVERLRFVQQNLPPQPRLPVLPVVPPAPPVCADAADDMLAAPLAALAAAIKAARHGTPP